MQLTWRAALLQNKQTDQTKNARIRLLIPATLIVFLLLAATASVSVLFLKYRMEHARAFSANALRERIGVDFGFDAIETKGLRSLRIKGLRLAMPLPGMGQAALNVDSAQVTLSLTELFRGRAVIGEAEINKARLVIDGTKEIAPRKNNQNRTSRTPEELLAMLPPVAVYVNNSIIELHITPNTAPVLIEDISLQFSNAPNLSEAQLHLTANSTTEDVFGEFIFEGAYRLPDIIDARVGIQNISAAHLRHFLKMPEGVDGRVSARIHAFGMLKHQITAELEAEVNKVSFPAAPAGMERIGGALNASLQWDAAAQKIRLLDGKANTSLADMDVRGTLDITQSPPVVNATATISNIPAETLFAAYLGDDAARFGELDIALSPDTRITVSAQGAVDSLTTKAAAYAPLLTLAVRPNDKTLPHGNARIEQISVTWDDFSGMPVGTANLVDGTVVAEMLGVAASNIAGTLSFDGDAVSLRPITATISTKPWSGAASYSLSNRELTFDVNGALTNIEQTPLHDLVKKLWLGGEISLRARGTFGPEGRLRLQGNADITRGMVAFEWWLRKPIGVGASIHTIEVDMIPGRTLDVQGEASIEDTRIIADLDYVYAEGKFQQKRIRVDVPHLEINSAGKCVQIPYTALGTACQDAYYESNLVGDVFGDDIAKIGGHFDYVSFLPDGGENPLVCRDADVLVTLTDIKDVERSASLVVHAGEAHVPPFGDDWLLPLEPDDPEYYEEEENDEPKPPQPWTYTLSADKISVPPWEGNNFAAEIYNNEEETGFVFFRADVGSGRLEGKHRHEKEDNIMHLEAVWESIPAGYIIRHLELPEVLAGDISGNIIYVVDQDDPRATMRADGEFTVRDGHFIPEQLAFMLANTLGNSFIALHPDALTFKEVSSKVRIEGDQIHTTDLVIDSEGMRITGNGVWVMEGDLDYRIDVAITPDLADQIPLLRDYFNVQGFRMTQQNIELGFHLTGPTFQPTGQLAGLPPIGVTIV
ncbi:MAG TPA: hypothetical protein ENN29_13375, partial [Candidatus Hydrogenedentes bacterium]|nr:hypothetical protein [Candidatus Hydrogenedentota bacterium]